MKDPNYFPATIANYILGGGGEAGSLFMNLREKTDLLTELIQI
ncbi:hypothetical protein [Chryseobacterium indoltheticum]